MLVNIKDCEYSVPQSRLIAMQSSASVAFIVPWGHLYEVQTLQVRSESDSSTESRIYLGMNNSQNYGNDYDSNNMTAMTGPAGTGYINAAEGMGIGPWVYGDHDVIIHKKSMSSSAIYFGAGSSNSDYIGIDKNNPLYLTPGMTIKPYAQTDNYLHLLISFIDHWG